MLGGGQYDMFVSYAHDNSAWVFSFVDDLHDSGYSVWLDRDSIRLGQMWRSEMQAGIENARFFVVVVTPEATRSRWVKKEIQHAKRLNKPIIPIIRGDGLERLGVDKTQGVDFCSVPYDTAFKRLCDQLTRQGLQAVPRPKEELRAVLRAGTETFGELAQRWRHLPFDDRDDAPVALQFARDDEGIGIAAFLVGRRNEPVAPPESVQIFLQFTGSLNESTFDDYLDYVRANRDIPKLHTVLIRGPQDPGREKYWLPTQDDHLAVWEQVVKFVQSATNQGTFGARRLAFYLNTPNALSIALGHRLKLKLPYTIHHYTERPRQSDMYVAVYDYAP